MPKPSSLLQGNWTSLPHYFPALCQKSSYKSCHESCQLAYTTRPFVYSFSVAAKANGSLDASASLLFRHRQHLLTAARTGGLSTTAAAVASSHPWKAATK
jgi:hypothetical protein